MEKNKNLMDQVFALYNNADNLREAIVQVATVCDTDNRDNNIFPAKKRVIEIMADALIKMEEVASLIEEHSSSSHESPDIQESDGVFVTKEDAKILQRLKDFSQNCNTRISELNEANIEFVHRLDRDTLEDDVNILQFICRAIDDFRYLGDLIREIKYQNRTL